MGGRPQLSIVMGVYNGASHLSATLDSILEQRGVDFECIVIDDGSTDSTWSILEQRAAVDSRLQLHRVAHAGLTRALIAGCVRARGEFVARQDVGDVSHPERLHHQCALLASNRDYSFSACQYLLIGPAGELLGGPEPEDGGCAMISSLREAPASGMRGPHHGSVMFRRSAYERVGGYRSEFYFAQDLDLWARLIEVGELTFVGKPLYRVQFAPASITARYRPQQLMLRELIREATLLRRAGQSEAGVLRRAAAVRPESNGKAGSLAAAEYFIGSCLYRRGDPAASDYLRRAVAANPLHLKAWIKLLGRRRRQSA